MTKIRANGIELEFDETGPANGIPFLMINGFGSQMTSWSDEFRQSLAGSGLRFIRFDNRDVGLSQKWHGIVPKPREVLDAVREGRKPEIPYTLNDMAADATGLLDALGIESAHIAGASMGGMMRNSSHSTTRPRRVRSSRFFRRPAIRRCRRPVPRRRPPS